LSNGMSTQKIRPSPVSAALADRSGLRGDDPSAW
jgi:hypothetical protein